jgi:outer membrane biosynthesis protein TonB
MWGPVLGWCALELLAQSIDVENPERVALDLFDRLRLREPFAKAFAALGFEGEEGWRVAARIKVVLLTGAGVGKPQETTAEAEEVAEVPVSTTAANVPATGEAAPKPASPQPATAEPEAAADEKVALSPALWLDPDVRWLTGVHEAGGHAYLVSELYEELLWWLLMPSLLRMAGEAVPSRAAVVELSKTVEEALATAKAAGYRIDALLGQEPAPDASEEPAAEVESQVLEEEQPPTDEADTQEPVIEWPIEAEPEPAEPEPVEPEAAEPNPVEPV